MGAPADAIPLLGAAEVAWAGGKKLCGAKVGSAAPNPEAAAGAELGAGPAVEGGGGMERNEGWEKVGTFGWVVLVLLLWLEACWERAAGKP